MQLRNLALALAAIPLAGCGIADIRIGHGVQGTGSVKTESRSVSGFTKVEINRAIQATIAVDGKELVEVKASESLLPIVSTKVENGVLIVDTTKDYSTSAPIEAIIHCKSLADLQVNGASHAEISGVDANEIKLEATGASKIELSGNVSAVNVEASGASTVDITGATMDNLFAEANGASTIKAGAIQSLEANASGASNISYKGDPKIIQKDATGASKITKL